MGSNYFPSPMELVQLLYIAEPLSYATLLLWLLLLTLTFDGAFYTRLSRFILLPPVLYYFWKTCSLYHLFSSCFMVTGVSTVACYGCFLALQFTTKDDNRVVVVVYHDPQSFFERVFYVLDLVCSLRGTSWVCDREWNWRYPLARGSQYRGPKLSKVLCRNSLRRDFLTDSAKKAIKLFILLDIFDTIVKSRTWDLQTHQPLNVVSIWQQCAVAIVLCMGISITLDIHYTALSALAVLLGNNPSNWSSLFYSPFQATSISDFWSNRWHQLFRHSFTQLSTPAVQFVQRLFRCKRGLPVTLTRMFCAFGISTMLHLLIMYHAERWCVFKLGDGNIDQVSFWDIDVAFFFMAQPFGMLFEKYVLEAIVIDWIFPPSFNASPVNGFTESHYQQVQSKPLPRREKVLIMRILAWTFLAWTGRWWTNKWIRSGFFSNETKAVPLSLIRSLWYRKIVL